MDKKTNSGAIASVNEQLAEELHQPVIKKLGIQEKSIQDLKTIFRQLI